MPPSGMIAWISRPCADVPSTSTARLRTGQRAPRGRTTSDPILPPYSSAVMAVVIGAASARTTKKVGIGPNGRIPTCQSVGAYRLLGSGYDRMNK